MKAVVVEKNGGMPQYKDFPDPKVYEGGTLINVKAVALKNYGDYSPQKSSFVIGYEGVGELGNGTRVFFGSPYGAMAEKAVVYEGVRDDAGGYFSEIPKNLDIYETAALPSIALDSLIALKYVAKMQKGEIVLINGATGVSGKIAVQIAKMLGAKRVVGTGKDDKELKKIKDLGADAVIDLKKSDEEIAKKIVKEQWSGYNVILDFTWGHPTELLLKTLGDKWTAFGTRFVQVKSSAGNSISLTPKFLINSGFKMMGAENYDRYHLYDSVDYVGKTWKWIKENKLKIDIEKVPMKNISEAWAGKKEGKQIVIIP